MDENSDEQDEEMTRGELLDFLGDFLSQHRDANTLYRDHLCAVLIGRVHDEFGSEGLCNVMRQMDLKAKWVSDIIFEASDFDNSLFKRHGTYDDEIVEKARDTKAMIDAVATQTSLLMRLWKRRKSLRKRKTDVSFLGSHYESCSSF